MKSAIRTIVIFIFFLFSIKSVLFAQKDLTKDEIYQHWVNTENNKRQDSLIGRFDRETNYIIRRFVDSLLKSKIDSIIVYSESYPGYCSKKSTCLQGLYPVYTYIIWKQGKQSIIRKIEGSCLLDQRKINSTLLFDFYDEYQQELNIEVIIPPIYSGQMHNADKFSFIVSETYHQPKYFLHFKFGERYRVVEFSENDLQDTKSLFYSDNLNSKLYQWWVDIKSQTTK